MKTIGAINQKEVLRNAIAESNGKQSLEVRVIVSFRTSFRVGLPIMLCGRRRRCTSTGSPAQNNGPCFWPALPSPPQLVPRGPPIVDQNQVANHAVRSASTLHLHREPCSEQRALFLACPTLLPTVGPQGTPYCRS